MMTRPHLGGGTGIHNKTKSRCFPVITRWSGYINKAVYVVAKASPPAIIGR